MSEWISVKESLPPIGKPVLAIDRYGARRQKGKITQVTRLEVHQEDWEYSKYPNCDCVRRPRYSHWTDLPKIPTEE